MHLLFETLAYAAAFALFRAQRRRRGDFLEDGARWTLIVVLILGAAVGSKLLHHLAHPALWSELAHDPIHLAGGKSIVGALLGGWLAVEVAKKRMGIQRSTGDVYALPLVLGTAIGRIGCYFAGLADHTYGVATTLPFGVDFGDGIRRHPTQLYEIVFLVVLGILLLRGARLGAAEGGVFRFYLAAYLLFRFVIDFIKPYERIAGLGAIQWACLVGLLGIAVLWSRTRERVGSPAR